MDAGISYVLGFVFWAIAAYFIYSGFIVPTSFEGVANLEAMHIQSLNFTTGIGAGIVGTMFLCTAAILSRAVPPAQS